MADVFISYSWEDKKTVTRIHEDLVRHKITVWRDTDQFQVGASLSDAIPKAIQDCKFFCLMVSPDALASEWVQKEFACARQAAKTILPCLLHQIKMMKLGKPSHPFHGLQDIIYADFTGAYEEGIIQLLEKIGVTYEPFYPDVEEFLEELRKKIEPTPKGIYRLLGDYFQEADRSRKREKYEQAIQNLEIIVRIKPELITPKIALGICYALAEKHVEAAKEFVQVTASLKSDYRGWAGLGAAKYYLGDCAGAVAAFREALEVRRDAYELLNNYGRALLGVRRGTEAIEVFRKAHEQDPRDRNILAGLGTALLWDGQFQKAIAEFKKALEDSAKPLDEAVCGLGEALENLNQFDEALETYQKYYQAGGPEVIRRLARLEWRMGNSDRSLQLYKELCRETDNRQVYLVEMAQLLYKQGRYNDMRSKCEDSLKSRLVSASDFYYAGLACYLLGEKIAASCFYNTACSMDVEYAKFAYQKLM